MTTPPLFAGAVNVISADVLVASDTEAAVGESGTERGMTFTAAEPALVPFRLLACTETEYVVPFVRPEIVQEAEGQTVTQL